MSDTDVDYGHEDPSDVILRDQRQTTSRVMASLDDDPEKASRAIELGQATGDHPALIYANLENYETQHKAALTSQLLNSSKFLRQYVDADPMHAKISNDDYGNLDNVSQRLIQSSLPGMAFGVSKAVVPAAIEGFKKGWENVTNAPHITDEELRKYPLFTALMQSARFPVDVGGALIEAGTSAIGAGTKELYKQFTGDEAGADRFGREMSAMAETVLTNTSGYHGIHAPTSAQLTKVHSILDKAKPWIDDNREPPRGLDPEIDKLKFEQNKLDLDNLDEAFKASQQSATRERNPDIFASFIRQHTDAKIGISGDAVARLYGEKLPEAGDNILGWAPGLAEELEIAKATGGDVHIPLADWLAKVDPEVEKVLHDDIRVRPGGITKVEKETEAESRKEASQKQAEIKYNPAILIDGKVYRGINHGDALERAALALKESPDALIERLGGNNKAFDEANGFVDEDGQFITRTTAYESLKPAEPLPEALPSLRGSSALEPLFSIGDRKLELKRITENKGKTPAAGMEGFHDFDILDEQGKNVGSINLSEQHGGKQLYIEMINGIGPYGPRSFGPALMRDLLTRQLKAEFPEAESITGHRVSGARDKAGTYDQPSAMVTLKLDNPSWAEIESFRQVLEDGQWKSMGLGLEAYIKPTELLTKHEQELSNIIREELARITPKQADMFTSSGLRREGSQQNVRGAYTQYTDRDPLITVALDSSDPIGVARHEAIHHLRQQGFFKEGEWETLSRAARDEDWIKKFGIESRYSKLEQSAKLEEAIADGYRNWKEGKPTSPKAVTIFERLKEFFDTIKARFKEILGHEPTWEELFQKVDEGEIGSREGNAPRREGAYKESITSIETPEFRNWFGNSKVVDETGKPIEVYHGTASGDITVFKSGEPPVRKGVKDINGIYFTENEASASGYANRSQRLGRGEQRRIVPVYLKIENPLDITETIRTFKNEGMSFGDAKREALKAFDKSKHDGIIFKGDDFNPAEYIVTRPEQVKSSTRNTGAFDINNLDIRFDEGDKPEFDKAAAIGMTIDQYKRYMKLIEKRHTEDLASSMARAEAEQRKRQTKEWKENEKEVRSQVNENIQARPDVAADLFFGFGELYGNKLGKRPKLNEADLTPEQIAKLPKEYIAKSGLNPDDAAGIFGYSSSAAMIDKLIEMNEAKTQLGLNTKDFLKRITDQEVERQMQAKYGSLEKSILEEAKDQAISETQLDLLHEEVYALALKAGGEFSITKADLKSWIKGQTNRTPIGSLDTDKFLSAAGKSGKAAEMALLKGDFAEAFREKQRQYLAMQMANEAKKIEKQVDQFDRQAKRLASRDQPSMDPTYVPFIHQILMQAGKTVKRSVQDLETALSNVGKTLEEFVDEKQQHSLREVPVAAFLYDPSFRKKFEDLTAEEFRAIHDSIKALSKNARDELKIYKAGEEADLADIKTKMVEQLREFKEIHYDASGGRWLFGMVPPKVAKVIRTYGAAHLQLESLFNRFDRGDPRGVFSQYVMRDLATSANYESALEKKYSRLLKEVDDGAKLSKSVDNPIFYNPLSKTGGDAGYLMQFTRKNLRAILLNAGNESNLAKIAKGYDLKPEQVRQWLDQHATKEDWAWAQKIGDVFAEVKKEADTMYSSLTGGVEPEAIDIKPFQTPHGEQKGWYYPIIYHPEFEGASRKLMGGDALEQDNFHRATTPAGYTKSRTGYTAPMSLDLDMLPVRMRQMLHDIALRPAVINASKIFYDKDVRAAIQKHYGNEYKELLIPYLKDVANSANFRDDASRTFANTSEFIRQNMISTLIGLNPGTVMKHGPTAAINSMTEVGIGNFAKAVSSLMSINERTGESNWKFAIQTSEELQRRHRHYNETLSGATQSLVPTSTYMSMRESLIKFSSTPVAISDLLSAVPTWLAKYETAMDEHGVHGDAIAEADRAVRRAHGSTAITNRSGVMRTGPMGAWMASVYGFFNHIMNRQYELMWKAGDTLGMVKEGDLAGAMKMTPELTVGLFSYVLLPALIEEMVTPLASDDHESWGKKAAKGLAYTLSASWIGVRDIASAMLRGQDPAVGLFSTSYKSFVDIARDLNKDRPFSKEHAGKIIQHGATVIGTATGLMNAQIGKATRYGYDISTGKEKPKGPWSWMVGARFGTTDKHSKTFEEWLKHH